MKTTMMTLAVVFFGVVSIADGAITLLPWTTTETDKFTTHCLRPGGDVWVGNTLTLTFEGAGGKNFPCSSTDDGDGTGVPVIVFPDVGTQFVVGLRFEVSSSLESVRASVDAQASDFDENTIFHNHVTSEIQISDTGSIEGSFDLSDWIFWKSPSLVYFDIPETTVNGVTSVDFFLLPETFEKPVLSIRFKADSLGCCGVMAGTLTYANVSWLVSDDPPTNFIPEPSALTLAAFVLLGLAYARRRL